MNANVHISKFQESQDENIGNRQYDFVKDVKNEDVLNDSFGIL